MLGTMAGFWISIALGVFCFLMLIGSLFAGEEKKIDRGSVLYLDLSGVVEERFQPQTLMEMLQDADQKAPTLQEMTAALRMAADDNKIAAVFIECGGASMGMASREELAQALADFRAASGKPIYAYADVYSQGDYLTACNADSVFLNPMGSVDIHGIGGTVPFFKGTLDRLGIKMQILKVGTFKSAVEPFMLTEMSQPARLQMQQYCDTLWAYASGEISTLRDIPEDTVRALASEMIASRMGACMQTLGLVDATLYRRQAFESLAEALDKDSADDLNFVTPAEYLATAAAIKTLVSSTKPHIAVLYAVGDIVDSGEGGIAGDEMVPEILRLADDDNVRAMVLRVNSGGGSAFASEQIWEALEYFKAQDKTLYVSMGDYAASGGYYISCGADRIYADRTTITGSIGVFGMIPDFSGLVTDKLGVTFSTVETNPNAAGISLMEPLTPGQRQAMQTGVEEIYDLFTGRVARGRGIDVDSVRAIAEGRVWVGSSALGLHLVDELGSLHDCIADIAAHTGLSADDVVEYPEVQEKMWMTMLRESGELDAAISGINNAGVDAETLRHLQLLRRLRNMSPYQARMEEVIIR